MKRVTGLHKNIQRLFSLRNKVALVTGASGGIGREFAIALAQAGARVALHGTKEENLETTRQFVEKAGSKGLVLPATSPKLPAAKNW